MAGRSHPGFSFNVASPQSLVGEWDQEFKRPFYIVTGQLFILLGHPSHGESYWIQQTTLRPLRVLYQRYSFAGLALAMFSALKQVQSGLELAANVGSNFDKGQGRGVRCRDQWLCGGMGVYASHFMRLKNICKECIQLTANSISYRFAITGLRWTWVTFLCNRLLFHSTGRLYYKSIALAYGWMWLSLNFALSNLQTQFQKKKSKFVSNPLLNPFCEIML